MKYSSGFNIKTNNDQDYHNTKRLMMINGPRPSPLKIGKDSHTIHKPSDRRQPVIIYTHSPKIIHTQARDFMALVQRLTGLSKDDHTNIINNNKNGNSNNDNNYSNSSSSDISTDEIDCNVVKPYFADIPLFTPSGTDVAVAANAATSSLSPSVLEFMKALPHFSYNN